MDDESSYQLRITSTDGREVIALNGFLQTAVETALRLHHVAAADVHFVLTSDAEIARLNQTFLGHDGPTDVLTFDLTEGSAPTVIEGEVVLSLDTAAREAARRRHSTEAELTLYALHGVLHLLGYDDATVEQARRMHRMEDRLLTSIGLGRVYDDTPGDRTVRKSPGRGPRRRRISAATS